MFSIDEESRKTATARERQPEMSVELAALKDRNRINQQSVAGPLQTWEIIKLTLRYSNGIVEASWDNNTTWFRVSPLAFMKAMWPQI